MTGAWLRNAGLAAALALLAGAPALPVHAQQIINNDTSGVGLNLLADKPPLAPEIIEKREETDRAYRAATKKIPEQKASSDPWGTIRPVEPAPALKPKPKKQQQGAQ